MRASLLALLVLCAGARLWGLGREALWEDEIRTARLAAVPAGDLLRWVLVEQRFAVPLLHLWVAKAGLALDLGELGLRLPAALFGIAGMAAVYLLGREVHAPREGWIAACFLAVSHEHLYYSREARPYALLVLVVTLLVWATLRAVRTQSPRHWMLAGGLAALGCNVHFLGVFPALGAAAAAAGFALHRRSLRGLLALGLPFLLLMPVWIALLDGLSFLDAEGRAPLRLFQDPWASHLASTLGPGKPILFALTAALACAGLLAAWRGNRTWLWIALLQLAVPLVLLQSVSFGHGFAPRYLLFLLPVLAVLQARGLTWLAEHVSCTAPARALVALALVALHLPAWQQSFEPKRRDWRGAAAAVKAFAPERTVILSSSTAPHPTDQDVSLECLGYYLGDPDGFSMPNGYSILAPGLASAPGLDLEGHTRERPVCALLTHGDQRVDTPFDLDAVSVKGITLLFPRQPAWRSTDQAALLLVAQAHAAACLPEAEALMRRALELARCSPDAAARAALADACAKTLAVKAESLPLSEYQSLLRLDWLLVEAGTVLGDLPRGPARWLLEQRIGMAYRIAAEHMRGSGHLQREIKLLARAYELGTATRAEVEDLAARCRSVDRGEQAAELAQLLR